MHLFSNTTLRTISYGDAPVRLAMEVRGRGEVRCTVRSAMHEAYVCLLTNDEPLVTLGTLSIRYTCKLC